MQFFNSYYHCTHTIPCDITLPLEVASRQERPRNICKDTYIKAITVFRYLIYHRLAGLELGIQLYPVDTYLNIHIHYE